MPELLSGINTDHTPREPRGVKRLNYWVKDEEIYRQWFEYLAISPSYQLAHLHSTVGLTAEQAASKPKDFDAVLAVYDDLGPVQEVLFNTWLNGNAIRYFGHPGRQPKVELIGYLGTSEDQQRVSQRALRNAERNWENEGGHPSRVLAIPDGLPFSEVVKQLKKLVKKSSQVAEVENMLGPKYPLLRQRNRSDNYQGYLKVVRCRAEFPDWPLWKIGLEAELSRTYKHQLGAAEDVIPTQRNEAARRSLEVMVNRAIARVKLLSENAARGKFPSLYDCPHAMDLDWGLILQSGVLRQEWEQRTVKEQTEKNAHWLMMPLTFLSKDWLWFELNLFDALGNCDL